MSTRLTLLDEKSFWIYYLYIDPGDGAGKYRLMDSGDRPVAGLVGVDIKFNLNSTSGQCILTIGNQQIRTRIVYTEVV